MEVTTPNNLHPVLSQWFKNRKLNEENIADLFSHDLTSLPNLTTLRDLKKSSIYLADTIEKKETIGIYGDYDADGVTSCALLFHFFTSLGATTHTMQPSRFKEGYGLHPSSIDEALKAGVKTLITVDCGITSGEAATYAKEKNLSLIITDHHKDTAEDLPVAYAVINPNRRDETPSPLQSLAGVGVAFALAVGIREELMKRGRKIETLYKLLNFVAIGTICDQVPLNPTNLKLVRHGLKQIPQTPYKGIRTFLSQTERTQKTISRESIAFRIGPMINAKGRLDHPDLALELLKTNNLDEAVDHYQHLLACNNERKTIQGTLFREAREEVLKTLDNPHCISLPYAPHWHEGVIGIVASKLVDYFKVPAIVFTNSQEKGIIKASARSAGTLNLIEMLQEHKDLFTKFGGHKAAAGLSMPSENLPQLKKLLTTYLQKIPVSLRTNEDYYDIDLSPENINLDLLHQLEALEPFGQGNPQPLFRLSGMKLEKFDVLKEVHVRWFFTSPFGNFKGISFNYLDKWGKVPPQEIYQSCQTGKNLYIYCHLGINRWRDHKSIQLNVERFESF